MANTVGKENVWTCRKHISSSLCGLHTERWRWYTSKAQMVSLGFTSPIASCSEQQLPSSASIGWVGLSGICWIVIWGYLLLFISTTLYFSVQKRLPTKWTKCVQTSSLYWGGTITLLVRKVNHSNSPSMFLEPPWTWRSWKKMNWL